MNLSVLYRGPLTSCNYACSYCPFAKRTESEERLDEDRAALDRFENWLSGQTAHRWRILFTPWGEALVREWYRRSLVRLSQLEHVDSVAAQTNLSSGLDWLSECDASRLALWATYHPTEVDGDTFVRRVQKVRSHGIRLSVGVVGVPTAFSQIATLRQRLPPDVYLWINPQQPRPRPYTESEIEFLSSIDPYFERTRHPQRTLGQPCRAGESSFTVDGTGDIRRCHFVDDVIGNIQSPDWLTSLKSRPCPKRSCHCYLGLSQFTPLRLADVYGPNLLERIPLLPR